MKKILFILASFVFVSSLLAEQLLVWDFSQISKNHTFADWLKKENFEPQKGIGSFPFIAEFKNSRLHIVHTKENFGLYGVKQKLKNAQKLRVTWGVEKFFTKGDNWLKGMKRIPIHVTLSFGEEKISSGSFVVPKLPYFITFILTENIDNTKFYTAKYYKKGGRYYCASCPIEKGAVVVTEVDLLPILQKNYGLKQVPDITLVSIGVDNRSTSLDAIAFIEKVEVLR